METSQVEGVTVTVLLNSMSQSRHLDPHGSMRDCIGLYVSEGVRRRWGGVQWGLCVSGLCAAPVQGLDVSVCREQISVYFFV